MTKSAKLPHWVIVGGGAGGLELAALLGKSFGEKGQATITLVDACSTHIWKPLLHEVAAGTLDSHEDEVNYLAYSLNHYFQFCLGTFDGINRQQKTISLAPLSDDLQGEIMPRRQIGYDVLIIAIGSVANDFGIPGVHEHCLFLDHRVEADHFQQLLITHLMRLTYQAKWAKEPTPKPLSIAVVGGGATGVELIAELQQVLDQMVKRSMGLAAGAIRLTLIESNARLLPALNFAIAEGALAHLQAIGVQVLLDTRVTEAKVNGLCLSTGAFVEADMMVWAAGIKAPECLKALDGLAVNRLNQLLVKPSLQTTLDDSIFALGDCASCPQAGSDQSVPPRAQAAHEQASFLVQALKHYLKAETLPSFVYRDYGSLVSLGSQESIGRVQSGKFKLTIEGKAARLAYLSLYKRHQVVLHGSWRVMLLTLVNKFSRSVKPRFKLH